MKKLLVLICMFSLLCGVTQAQQRTFLRVYNIAGNKFSKGHFCGTTDSSLLLYKDSAIREVLASNIGYIKTRHSLGHNVLLGVLTGAIPAAVFGAVGGERKVNDNSFGGLLHDAVTFTPAEGIAAGLMLGGIAGGATGTIISAASKSVIFTINGSVNTWQTERKIIDLLPAGK